ncbi:hypothetical protein WN73_37755 [Bradyrhizobium sp. CCBAU 45394]|uniref:NACHT and WD repeat domain-containing protein n=1 Tax=Bradyrhizobium sp. CCBAU 45394 TaxID=1325087 RepID=UPI0023049091|nr:hypothetical protein [Bradyrhizobium sp. CCBAU 45394]MDA9396264.1 hypothetical protein [Bradyrhizobium sp. CCBAU 45394]
MPDAEIADLFFHGVTQAYIGAPRFVRREWLEDELREQLDRPDCRFVLVVAEPGSGKSSFIAQLANNNTDWPVFYIRRDQTTSIGETSARSFLLRIGWQLAALRPELFDLDSVEVDVTQSVGDIPEGADVIGARVERLRASPFHQAAIRISQTVERAAGKLIGLSVGEWITDPRLLAVDDLQEMGLFAPARRLARVEPSAQLVILVDAVDELAFGEAEGNLLEWLANGPDLPNNVRIVVSCRPAYRQLDLFTERRKGPLRLLPLDAHDPRVQEDVSRYAELLVRQAAVAAAVEQAGRSSRAFVSELTLRADGNIGYAAAIGRAFDQALARPEQKVLIERLLRLDSLPEDLGALFAFFLKLIRGGPGRSRIKVIDTVTGESALLESWSELYQPILALLSIAQQPLTLDQVQGISGTAAGRAQVAQALGWLEQFLSRIGDAYQLYHAAFADFMTAQTTLDSPSTADLWVDARLEHRRLARAVAEVSAPDVVFDDTPELHRRGRRAYARLHYVTHLCLGGDFEGAASVLTQITWLRKKTARCGIEATLGDFRVYASTAEVISDEVGRTADLLTAAARILRDDPGQFDLQVKLRSPPDLKSKLAFESAALPGLVPVRSGDYAKPNAVLSLRRVPSAVTCAAVLAIAQSVLGLYGTASGEIVAIDVPSGKIKYSIRAHDDDLRCLALSPQAGLLASGSGHWLDAHFDVSIKLWDMATGKFIRTLMSNEMGDSTEGAHAQPVGALAFAQDGDVLISAGWDRVVKVWDPAAAKLLLTLEGHTEGINAVAVSTDQSKIISGSTDQTVKFWSLDTGEHLRSADLKLGSVLALVPLRDPRWVVALAEYGAIRIDIEDGALKPIYLDEDRILCLDEQDDGHLRAICESGRRLFIDAQDPDGPICYPLRQPMTVAACDRDLPWAVGAFNRQVVAVDVRETTHADDDTEGHVGRVAMIAGSRSGAVAATVGLDGVICCWKSPEWRQTNSHAHGENLICASGIDRGRFLTLGRDVGKIWRVEDDDLRCERQWKIPRQDVPILGQRFKPHWSDAAATERFCFLIQYDMLCPFMIFDTRTSEVLDSGALGRPRGFHAFMGDAAGAPMHASGYFGYLAADYARDIVILDLNMEPDLFILDLFEPKMRRFPRHRLYGGLEALEILPSLHCAIELSEGVVAALDYLNHRVMWQRACGAVSIFVDDEGGCLYSLAGDGNILRFDVKTGRQKTYSFNLRKSRTHILTVLDGDIVVLSDWDNFLTFCKLSAESIVGVVGLDSKAVGCALSRSAQQILIVEDVGRSTTFQFLDP